MVNHKGLWAGRGYLLCEKSLESPLGDMKVVLEEEEVAEKKNEEEEGKEVHVVKTVLFLYLSYALYGGGSK